MNRLLLTSLALLTLTVAAATPIHAAPLPGLRDCPDGEFGIDAGPVGTGCSPVFEYYYCPHMKSGFRVLGTDTGCMGNNPNDPDGS